jgi:3-dehydroquinate synthase
MIDRNSVVIEPGLAGRLAPHLAPFTKRGRLFIVADKTAWHFHGERVLAGLVDAEVITIESGEDSKSWPQLIALIDRLLEEGIARSDTMVAFGGGVVGDLAGFAAAIVKRGCRFVQIPTSLLAQVDSAIGGKTAINVTAGKNLVGAFHQPELVLIDPELLSTLGTRHIRAGYAEVVKYGLIDDPAFFGWLEANGDAVLSLQPGPLLHAIRTSIAAKLRFVSEDERDTKGRRALLNLGHTFAHALEAETGFSDRLLHGEAVAIGMVHAFRFSEMRGLCSRADADRVEDHLRSAGLPVRTELDPARLTAHMRQDKKRESGKSAFVLTRGIGRAFIERDVPLAEVEKYLRQSIAVTC